APAGAGRHLLLRTALAWEARERPAEAPSTALERRLAVSCRTLGLPVELGAGRSRRVPVAVRRPDGTGPALAVQMDGPAWAAADVVEREVSGPAGLERRGWRCVRALGTDVLADPAAEAERVGQRWREAVAEHGDDTGLVLDLRGAGGTGEAPAPPAAPDPGAAVRPGAQGGAVGPQGDDEARLPREEAS
ncbi:hypothetical protein GTR00_21560, partial [Kineococcus sp. T90]